MQARCSGVCIRAFGNNSELRDDGEDDGTYKHSEAAAAAAAAAADDDKTSFTASASPSHAA
jgi:hypothetical protein